jgi:glyoxylase-like metal-dependent hydrolase (beta-lactamase superfamily II)
VATTLRRRRFRRSWWWPGGRTPSAEAQNVCRQGKTEPAPASIETFPWIHGAEICACSTDPLLQEYRFDADTFIFRVSKCFSYEGNFLYLLIGDERALLLDSGPSQEGTGPPAILPVRDMVEAAIESRRRERGQAGQIGLIVAHTHGHGDHAYGDDQFEARPDATVVAPGLGSVQAFFGLADWPEGRSELDLGGRGLIVLPLPGHAADHIAVYDARTRLLLTGDTLDC